MFKKSAFEAFLRTPWVDKVLGFIAASPSVLAVYLFYGQVLMGHFDIYRAAVTLNAAVLLTTILIRRTAKRVTVDPIFWAITFGRNYWMYLVLWYTNLLPTTPIAPAVVTNALLFLAMLIIIYSRLSLGRNIGFLPAQREIVTSGAYGYVRHPIHTAEIIFFVAFLLAQYSVFNLLLIGIGIAFLVNKSLIEESFLQGDAEYAQYCKNVHYRWVPGVI